MQYVKRVLAIAFVLMLVFMLTAPCFGAGAATLTAAEELLALWSLYSESVGLESVYSVGGVRSSASNPFSNSVAANNFSDLYNQYCTYSGRVESVQDTVDWIKANTAIAMSVQQQGAFEYAAGVTAFFDRFTTWILEDVVGLIKNPDGLFETNRPWFNNTMVILNGATTLPVPNIGWEPSRANVVNNGLYVGTKNSNGNNYYMAVYGNSNDVFVFQIAGVLYAASLTFFRYVICTSNGSYTLQDPVSYNDIYVYRVQSSDLSNITWYIPEYASLQTFADILTGTASDEEQRIQIGPKDITADGTLGIPDVNAQDYAPTTTTGVLDMDAAGVNDIDDALPDVLTNVLSNVASLVDTLAQGIVMSSPFIPFAGLPSFSFGFSGIWHYVTEWIASLGSGLSFFTAIWSNIPYAMVIPIWAAAVVVIITSVFKRFV